MQSCLCARCLVTASCLLQVGLSRLINSSSHQQSSFQLGTFEYTAPELLTGKRCNEKVCLELHELVALSTVSHAAGSSRKVWSSWQPMVWVCWQQLTPSLLPCRSTSIASGLYCESLTLAAQDA